MKRLFITLTLTLVAFMANAQSCPDNNHPHAIDLGLPSGTKWACCNVGATAPEGHGGYYAWGETEEKAKYDWTTYTHCDGSMDTCHDLGSDIAGTEYDVAHVKWGGSWVIPSLDQIKELASNCSCTWTRINDVYGDLFTGPNGSTIFLPESGFWRNDGKQGNTDEIPISGNYWSSTIRPSYKSVASYLLSSYGYAYWDNYNALCMGLTVRPVMSEVAAKETSYHPFVERGKHWCVHGFSMGSHHTVTDYYFSVDKILFERNGHSYEQLRARTEDGKDELVGWFYEENQRVYMYNEEEDKDVLTYDFSLNVGDRFEPEYGDFECCEVTKIDYIVVNGDSLKVINFEANDKTSYLTVRVNGRWIEGIGSEMNPLDGLFSHSAPNSWSYYLAYVSGSSYWPFTFSLPFNGWWGQKLTRGKEDPEYEITHSFDENDLHYELVPDPEHDAYALHVSGIMWLPCGGDLYIYCRRERTEDISAYKLYLQVDFPTEVTTCKSPYHVDLSFPFFLAENKYIAVDEQGEHPVAVRETSYHPFVEACKSWCMVTSNQEEQPSDTKVSFDYFDCKEMELDGKKYLPMYSRESWSYECEARRVGLFREDSQQVFFRSSETEEETMLYDFSLEVGETYHHPFYGDFKVTKVGDIVVNNEHLKTISFNGSEEPDWIEGIGSLNSLIWEPAVLPGMFFEKIVYVSYSDERVEWETIYEHDYKYGDEGVRFPEHYYYLPLSFMLYTPEGHWRGQDLKAAEKMDFDEVTDSLEYILRYNTENDDYDLYISGRKILNCGPNHYVYCIDEPTDDSLVQRISLKSEDVTPLADCEGGYKVNLVFPHFDKDKTYIITDEQGEHILSTREPEAHYRPFIEEGKVWKVGWFPGGMNTAQKLDYYYFEGDSIIDSRQCKKMMCRHEANERWGNSEPWTEYVGSIYEEERRVYCVFPGKQDFMLLYDFATPIGEKIDIYDPCTDDKSNSCIIERRFFATNEYYKGYSTAVALYQEIWLDEDEEHNVPLDYDHEHLCYWIEGIGNDDPLRNVFHYGWAGNYYYGMSCTIGDEVLYYLPYLKDGVTPDDSQVKKQWIDFTHITKPRPKAPLRVGNAGESEENLTGEYSVKQLFVNLKILSGTYTVTLRDAADNEVYRKDVQTSSTIALNTDLTKYPAGTYTLVVENSEEQYTATLTLPLDDTAVRDIPSDQIVNSKSLNSKCFDLSGRQLSTPPAKGIYIREGKKMMVK